MHCTILVHSNQTTSVVQDILADHLDPETEEQSAVVTLLNIVGQVCPQPLAAARPSGEYFELQR